MAKKVNSIKHPVRLLKDALCEIVTVYSDINNIVFNAHRCSRLNAQLSHIAGTRCFVTHSRNAEVGRICYQQTSTTNNIVDDTAYHSASAPSGTQTTMANGHKFSSVRRLSRKLFDRSTNAFYLPHIHLAPSLRVIPSEFYQDLWRQKTRVPGLLCGVVCVILHLAFW